MITALAHSHDPAPAFSSGFYTTCAAVISVLFLAIAVQGSVYDQIIALFRRIQRTSLDYAMK